MKYGLVLAGGGLRGAYHIGVWKALREMKIDITAVSGASIGAINGALFAQGDYDIAEEMWRRIDVDDVIALPEKMDDDNILKLSNVAMLAKEIYKNDGLDVSPLENLLREVIDEDRVRRSKIDFGISAFSISDKTEMSLFREDIPKGKMIEYIMASACFPVFKKRIIDKKKFIDGGVANNMPTDMLLSRGVDNIITVNVKGIGVYRSFNESGRNIIEIKCSHPEIGTLDFDKGNIDRSIGDGYFDCMKTFGRYMGEIYSFETGDYFAARGKYAKAIIDGIETAASAFCIDRFRLWTVDGLISAVMEKYAELSSARDYDANENIFEKIRALGESSLIVWLVKVLESQKSDFIKEKLSYIGTNYDAASSILYFKNQK